MTPAPLPEEDHHCESCGLRYGDLTPSAVLTVIAVRTTHPGDELAGAHHRVDTFSDTLPLIADWLDSTHP